jgi:hypothetical protein
MLAHVAFEKRLESAYLGVVAVCPVEAGGHAAKHFYRLLAFLIGSKERSLGTLWSMMGSSSCMFLQGLAMLGSLLTLVWWVVGHIDGSECVMNESNDDSEQLYIYIPTTVKPFFSR